MRYTILFVFGLLAAALSCGGAQAQDYTLCLHPSYTLNYGVYTSTANDQSHIYTSVTTDGSATMGYLPPYCGTPTHQPRALNQIGSVGGWGAGSASCPACYISFQNNQSIAATPGTIYTWQYQGTVFCSLGGFCFTSPPASLNIEIAYTRAISTGTQSNCYWNQAITQEVCDISAQPWCTAATSPPDWPVNTVSSQVYPPPPPSWWEAFNICLSYGSPGNLRPWVCGPTGFAIEQYTATPARASCTYNL